MILGWIEFDSKKSDNSEKSLTISLDFTNHSTYWEVRIVKVTGGTFNLDDAYFTIAPQMGSISRYELGIDRANPILRTSDGLTVYPIPYQFGGFGYENATFGDGEILDTDSVAKPEVWAGCFFAYLDVQSDNKVNNGDIIWVFKDYNDDGNIDLVTDNEITIRKRQKDDSIIIFRMEIPE